MPNITKLQFYCLFKNTLTAFRQIKFKIKLKIKPLHVTTVFQATISRKERQKTDCAYSTAQDRFLVSNGIIFPFFPLKSYFKSSAEYIYMHNETFSLVLLELLYML